MPSLRPITVPRSDFSARVMRALFSWAAGGYKQHMDEIYYSDGYLRGVLHRVRTIAAVGVSMNEVRPSFYVARYLKMKGYRVLPVNPAYAGKRVFGEIVHPALSELPKSADPVDMVEIFRRSEQAGDVVDEALDHLLHRGLKYIWMQIGVRNDAAARRAEAKGVEVLMNRCPKIEFQRLFGELRWGGFNTGVITSRITDPTHDRKPDFSGAVLRR